MCPRPRQDIKNDIEATSIAINHKQDEVKRLLNGLINMYSLNPNDEAARDQTIDHLDRLKDDINTLINDQKDYLIELYYS